MTTELWTLSNDVQMRLLQTKDVTELCAAYNRNREHLAPWEPVRADDFYTDVGHAMSIATKLNRLAAGIDFPCVLVAAEQVVGTITLSDIVRGAFLNAHVGYWVDRDFTGRGIGSAAVEAMIDVARTKLGLHRIQAATLSHNVPSQAVLEHAGFQKIGFAPKYLKIAGSWQDHTLYQRILF